MYSHHQLTQSGPKMKYKKDFDHEGRLLAIIVIHLMKRHSVIHLKYTESAHITIKRKKNQTITPNLIRDKH